MKFRKPKPYRDIKLKMLPEEVLLKRYKSWRFGYFTYLFSALMMMTLVVYTTYEYRLFKCETPVEEKIIFEGNYTDEEKQEIFLIINEIKEPYFNEIRSLTFTKDRITLFKYRNNFIDVYGYHQRRHVTVRTNLKRPSYPFHEVLCHELLHAITHGANEEYFVVQNHLTNVCYKDPNFIENYRYKYIQLD